MFKIIAFALLIVVILVPIAVFGLFYKPVLTRAELSDFQTSTSRFIALPNGANMHYRDEGKLNGPVLVMIHGGLGSLQNWEGWIEPLGKQFRLISMDLLGHGLTGTWSENLYTREAQRDAVHELMAALKIDHYAVAGNSFGGGIALEMALAYPKEVTGLILVDSEGIPNGENGYDASAFTTDTAAAPDDPSFTALTWYEKLGARFIGPTVVASVLESMVHNKDLLNDNFINRFARINRHTGNREAQILMFRQGLYVVQKNGPQDLLPRLKELKMPTLVMQGVNDTLVPMRVDETFKKNIANAKLARIEKAGHMPMIEKPQETAQVILDWFRTSSIVK